MSDLVQRGSGVNAHLLRSQRNDTVTIENRIEKHRDRPEDHDRRNGYGRFIGSGADRRLGAEHGGGSADTATDRREQRNAPIHLQQPSQQDPSANRDGHDDRIDQQGRSAHGQHVLKSQPETVQNDTQPQNALRAEQNAGNPRSRQPVAQTVRIEHAQHDAHDHRAERKAFDPRKIADIERCAGEQSDQQNAVQHIAPFFTHFHHPERFYVNEPGTKKRHSEQTPNDQILIRHNRKLSGGRHATGDTGESPHDHRRASHGQSHARPACPTPSICLNTRDCQGKHRSTRYNGNEQEKSRESVGALSRTDDGCRGGDRKKSEPTRSGTHGSYRP